MCIPAILHALIWKPSLTTAVPIEKAWASKKPLVTPFRPARWAPMVLELLEDSGTRVSSWNPASFLAKHYPSSTGLCLTDGLWVSSKQNKTRNLPNTQGDLFANVPLLFHAWKPLWSSQALSAFHLILLWMHKKCVLVTVYSFIKSSPLWAQYFFFTFVYCTGAVFSLKGQLFYQLFL